jgi:hypothetical protein
VANFARAESGAGTAFNALLFLMAVAVAALGCAFEAYHAGMTKAATLQAEGFLAWPGTQGGDYLCRFVPGRVIGFAVTPAVAGNAKFAGICVFLGGLLIMPFVFGWRLRGFQGRRLNVFLPVLAVALIGLGALLAVPAPPTAFSIDMGPNVVSRTLNQGVTIPYTAVTDVALRQAGKAADQRFSVFAVCGGGQGFELMDAQPAGDAQAIRTAILTFMGSGGRED